MLCPYCDAALTRVAVLSLALRKAAVWTHAELKHAGHSDTCTESPCLELWQALRYEGLPAAPIPHERAS